MNGHAPVVAMDQCFVGEGAPKDEEDEDDDIGLDGPLVLLLLDPEEVELRAAGPLFRLACLRRRWWSR